MPGITSDKRHEGYTSKDAVKVLEHDPDPSARSILLLGSNDDLG